MTCTHYPPVIPELPDPIGCGWASVVAAVRFASCGRIRPTLKDVRARVNIPTGTGDIFHFKAAFDSYIPDAAKLGLVIAPMVIRSPNGNKAPIFRPVSEFVAATQDPETSILFIGAYSVINASIPKQSGDRTYSGAHVMTWDGGLTRDPLRDGRRPGIPSGRYALGIGIASSFMAGFSRIGAGAPRVGPGFGVFGTVKRATPRVVTPADPPVIDHTEAEYEALAAELDTAQQRIDDLETVLYALRSDLAGGIALIDSVLPPPDPTIVTQSGVSATATDQTGGEA